MTLAPVAKLTLRPMTGGGAPLVLPFNPESFSVSGAGKYESIERPIGVPGMQYTGRAARQTSVEAMLDARALKKPVAVVVKQVFGWLKPTAASLAQKAPSPPRLAMSWGTQLFDVVLTDVTADYLVFKPDGTPTRAKLSMSFTELPRKNEKQNPTSGSLVGSRSHVVVAGDTLHSIATAEYGAPSLWWALAEANRIEDPLSVRPGTRLVLPAPSELEPAEQTPSVWS